MGSQRSDQRLVLINNGTASAGEEWRGGEGVATITGTIPSGSILLQMSPNNGVTWCTVRQYGSVSDALFDHLHAINFKLPACRLRASATGVDTTILAVSV